MAGKRGLGAGIDTLIPKRKESDSNTKTEVKTVVKEVDKIDINKIEPNNSQPRKNFNEDSLQELADSIKQQIIMRLLLERGDGEQQRLQG